MGSDERDMLSEIAAASVDGARVLRCLGSPAYGSYTAIKILKSTKYPSIGRDVQGMMNDRRRYSAAEGNLPKAAMMMAAPFNSFFFTQ